LRRLVSTLAAAAFVQVEARANGSDDPSSGLSCISCHTETRGGPLNELGRRSRWSGVWTAQSLADHRGDPFAARDEAATSQAPKRNPAGDWSGELTWWGRATRERVLGASQPQYLSTESLRLSGERLLGRDDLSFHGEGVARSNFSDPEGFDEDQAELISAELDWSGGPYGSAMRLGRQFVASGVTVKRLDGLWSYVPIGQRASIEAFGGVPSDRGFGGAAGDLLVGGRVASQIAPRTNAGLSGFYAEDDGDPTDGKFGLDLDTTPFDELQIVGHVFYDWIGERVYDARAHVVWTPSIEWQVAADYTLTVPGLFLPKDSIFSVFSVDDYEETSLAVTRRLDERRSVRAFARTTRYDGGSDVFHVGVGADARYGPGNEDAVGAEVAYQDETRPDLGGSSVDGDTLFVRAYHFFFWTGAVYTSLDVSLQAYAGDPFERDALLAQGAVGVRVSSGIDVLLGLDYTSDPEFEDRLGAFARATWRF
jgi:hypothetical protein